MDGDVALAMDGRRASPKKTEPKERRMNEKDVMDTEGHDEEPLLHDGGYFLFLSYQELRTRPLYHESETVVIMCTTFSLVLYQ
jgi:hypothetical protein